MTSRSAEALGPALLDGGVEQLAQRLTDAPDAVHQRRCRSSASYSVEEVVDHLAVQQGVVLQPVDRRWDVRQVVVGVALVVLERVDEVQRVAERRLVAVAALSVRVLVIVVIG